MNEARNLYGEKGVRIIGCKDRATDTKTTASITMNRSSGPVHLKLLKVAREVVPASIPASHLYVSPPLSAGDARFGRGLSDIVRENSINNHNGGMKSNGG